MTAANFTIPRWIPKNSREVPHRLGVCYVYESEPVGPNAIQSFNVIAYAGKARRSAFHESYRKAELRDKRVTDWFAGLEARERDVKQRALDRARPHTFQVGDIIHHSWGHEQTQADFYQVVAVTAHGATIREIAASTVPGSTYSHGMADMRVAVKDAFVGEEQKVFIDGYNTVTTLKHGHAGKWDGRPAYCSWYA